MSRERSAGAVLDCDATGSPVGIDIDHASRKIDVDRLVLSNMAGEVESVAV